MGKANSKSSKSSYSRRWERAIEMARWVLRYEKTHEWNWRAAKERRRKRRSSKGENSPGRKDGITAQGLCPILHRHGQEREEIESFGRRTSCKHNMRQVNFLKIITVCRATPWPMSCNVGIDAYFPVSDSQTPSVEECKLGWQVHKPIIEEISAQ